MGNTQFDRRSSAARVLESANPYNTTHTDTTNTTPHDDDDDDDDDISMMY